MDITQKLEVIGDTLKDVVDEGRSNLKGVTILHITCAPSGPNAEQNICTMYGNSMDVTQLLMKAMCKNSNFALVVQMAAQSFPIFNSMFGDKIREE